MPKWKLWQSQETESPPVASAAPTRFGIKPRTDVVRPEPTADPELAEKRSRLQRRREAVVFDVEHSELAATPDNPWEQRVALIEEALAAVRADRTRIASEHRPAGRPVQPTEITELSADPGPPPSVSFRVRGEQFEFEEELDWAERGFQLARSELHHRTGDIARALPTEEAADAELVEHLTKSMFVLASDLRDRALAAEPFPERITLADLARPDQTDGGWFDWSGHSAAAAQKQAELREIDAEEQRLLTERAREIEEMEKLADRLPIAQRRLAEVDAEIAALGVDR